LAYGVSNAISSGGITINGTGAVLALDIYSDTVGTITLTEGSITSTTGVLTGTSYVLNPASGKTITVSAILSGSATVTKSDSGTAVLSGNNTYTGLTTVSAGVLRVSHSNALGTTGNGTTVSNGAALELTYTPAPGVTGIAIGDEALTLNGDGISSGGSLRNISGHNTYGGLITLSTNAVRINSDANTLTLNKSTTAISATNINLTFGGDGQYIYVPNIIATGSGTITKNGSSSLYLTGDNSYTGTTTVSSGTLYIGHNNGLGTTANGTTVSSGAALYLYNDITVGAEALALGAGTFGSYTGSNVFQGVISLTANATIANITKDTLFAINSAGSITGTNRTLTFGGYGITVVDDPISIGSGGLVVSGNPVVYLQSNNTFTGGITLSGGVLAPYANTALGDSGSSNKITFQGGGIRHYSTNTSELYARYNTPANGYSWGIDPGDNIINYSEASSQTFGNPGGGSANFEVFASYGISGTIGTGTYSRTSPSTGTLVWDTTHNYSGTTIVRGATLQLTTLPLAGRNITVKGGTLDLNSQTTEVLGTVTIGGDNQDYAGGGSLNAIVPNGTLRATTYIFNANYSAVDTITAVIANGSDATAITKQSPGVTVLVSDNTYTGITNINGGTLRISKDTNLGPVPGSTTANSITFNGGTLNTTATFELDSKRGITLSSGGGAINTDSGTTLTYNGIIAGTGSLTKWGAGTLNLTSGSNNTYSGATYIHQGNHAITHANGLGTTGGATIVNYHNYGASLNISNNITVAEPITIYGTGVSGGGAIRLTSGSNTYSGSITLASNASIVSNSGVQIISGAINGSTSNLYSLSITATDNLTLTGTIGATAPPSSLSVTTTCDATCSGASPSRTGVLTLDKNVTTSGNQTYTAAGGINISRDITLTSGYTDIYSVWQNSTVTTNSALSGEYSLAITGNAVFGDGTSDTINLSGASKTLSVSGTTTINTNGITTSGTQTYSGAVTLGTGTTLTTTNSQITFVSTVNGTYGLTASVGTSEVQFDGIVGGVTGLGAIAITGALDLNAAITNATSLSVSTTSDIGANITTTGNITFTGNVNVSADVTVQSGAKTTYSTYTAYTVPTGVTAITVTAIGGAGGKGGNDGSNTGGLTGPVGSLTATFSVTAGDIIYIFPGSGGSQGQNSGSSAAGGAGGTNAAGIGSGGTGGKAGLTGTSGGGGGGGAATIVTKGIASPTTSSAMLLAGGGGGGGGSGNNSICPSACTGQDSGNYQSAGTFYGQAGYNYANRGDNGGGTGYELSSNEILDGGASGAGGGGLIGGLSNLAVFNSNEWTGRGGNRGSNGAANSFSTTSLSSSSTTRTSGQVGEVQLNSGGGTITFGGTVNGAKNLTVDATSGTVIYSNTVGNSAPLTSLNTTGATAITLNGAAVTTTGSQTFTGPITLGTTTTTLTTTNSPLILGGDVTKAAVTGNLTVSVGSGSVSANGTLGSNSTRLGDISITNTGTVTLSGTVYSNSFTKSGDSVTSINGSLIDTSTTQSFGGKVFLGGDTTLNSSGNITVTGAIYNSSQSDLTITANARQCKFTR
jgi:fibronectin-binding autotransporter adhesin